MIRRILLTVLMVTVVAGGALFAGGQAEESAAPATETDGAMESSAEDAADLERTPDDPRLYTPGKLTVATGDPVYPPWMLNDDPAGGEGFENGIVYALADEMGFDYDDVVWVTQTFDQGIAPGTQAVRLCDTAILGDGTAQGVCRFFNRLLPAGQGGYRAFRQRTVRRADV